MRNVVGICNFHDGPHLGELTKNRPLGTVTLLGRYALMDVALSNFSNSGIDRAALLTQGKDKKEKSEKTKVEEEQKLLCKKTPKLVKKTELKKQQPIQYKKNKTVVEEERTKPFIDFPLFDVDYIFVTIFSILLSFGFLVGLYKNKVGEGTSAGHGAG